MRAPLPERRARYCRLALGMGGLALAVLFLMPVPLYGEGHATSIKGRVVNGTSGVAAPTDLEVTLHIISRSGEVDIATALTDRDGRFQFQNVVVDNDFTYAVTTSYQDILYSSRLDSLALTEPVELTVYETTSSLEALHIDADVLLISGTDEDNRSLAAFEVVRLVNEGDRTFVPDLTQPGSMSFLRFSLPDGATNPDVASDLPGGQIIIVGTGFALTAPVTPGSHQVTYTYSLPYKGSHVELTHSYPMGAETFRLLLEDTLGDLQGSGVLTPQSPASMEGKAYRVWGASQLSPGTRLNVEIVGLPQPSLLQQLGDTLTDGPYLKIGIPGAVGLVLAGLLLYVLAFKQLGKATTANPGLGAAAAVMSIPASDQPERERRAMVEAIARLDDLSQRGEVTQEEYQQRRQELKARLLRLTLTSEGE